MSGQKSDSHVFNAAHTNARADYALKHGRAARKLRAAERRGEDTSSIVIPFQEDRVEHNGLPAWENRLLYR